MSQIWDFVNSNVFLLVLSGVVSAVVYLINVYTNHQAQKIEALQNKLDGFFTLLDSSNTLLSQEIKISIKDIRTELDITERKVDVLEREAATRVDLARVEELLLIRVDKYIDRVYHELNGIRSMLLKGS